MDSTNEETATPAMEKAPEPSPEALPDLKAARETRGLSLQDIFLATRVSVINLQAVENQEFNRLPPPVYARDYIRKYARAVGIDAKPLLDRYDRHRESVNPPPEETEVQKPWPENSRRYRFLFSTLGAVIVAGILVYALFLYYDQPGKATPLTAAVPAEPTTPAAVLITPPSEVLHLRRRIPLPGGAGTPAGKTPSGHRSQRTHLGADHTGRRSPPGPAATGRTDRTIGRRLFSSRCR